MCDTIGRLHPYQSSKDVDGVVGDREVIQDIAYDGETFEERLRPKQKRLYQKRANAPA